MANMSYCRFENTASDMADCLNALARGLNEGQTIAQFKEELSSDYERIGFQRLINLCQDFLEAIENGR